MNIELISQLFVHVHAHGMNIDHMIVSSLVHGLTYGAIFKVFHMVSPLVAVVIATVGVAALWFIFRKKRY